MGIQPHHQNAVRRHFYTKSVPTYTLHHYYITQNDLRKESAPPKGEFLRLSSADCSEGAATVFGERPMEEAASQNQ
jgi:hypothetical protein